MIRRDQCQSAGVARVWQASANLAEQID